MDHVPFRSLSGSGILVMAMLISGTSLSASDDVVRQSPPVLPLPANDTHAIDLFSSANIPLHPAEGALRVFDPQATLGPRLSLQGMELLLAPEKKLFVGVWKPVSDKQLEHREVSVAQADDKIRERVPLPETVDIPVGDTFAAISFLHTLKGAGEPGDVLFNYVVTYDDGGREVIPVREGERIGGQLKPATISLGREVYGNLVDARGLSFFITTWENPFPNKRIEAVAVQAMASQVIPITLGLAGHRSMPQTEPPPPPQGTVVTTTVDFTRKIRPVREGLFGINVPYAAKAEDERYFEEFRNVDFSTVRIWNQLSPVEGRAEPSAEELAKQDVWLEKLADGTRTRMLFNVKGLGTYPAEASELESHVKNCVKWHAAVVKHLVDDKHLPISCVEIFNEELMGHKDAKLKFQYYNLLARRIKTAHPRVKVGGTAECWPDTGVLEQFVIHCGKHLDMLTWHMYPTGSGATPTAPLMEGTGRMAAASRSVREMFRKHHPSKKLVQAITEYNMNHSSWKPPVEERQVIGTGCVWTMSVLGHLLYDGEADAAMFWHFWSGGNYGIVAANFTRRPAHTLFSLLNRHLRAAQVCQVASADRMVEVVAAEGPQAYVVITLNKSPAAVRIVPTVTGLRSPVRLEHATTYEIREKDVAFTTSRGAVDEPFMLEGYSMRFVVIPR